MKRTDKDSHDKLNRTHYSVIHNTEHGKIKHLSFHGDEDANESFFCYCTAGFNSVVKQIAHDDAQFQV